MLKTKADQIIQRIADANGVDPSIMRLQIEEALKNILGDFTQPHSFMLADLFPGGAPTVDELVVMLEFELYATMMPGAPGWEAEEESFPGAQSSGIPQ